MAARSAARAIRPSKTSSSRTRCPLPTPPIDGLQDICPASSGRKVSRPTRAPRRAAAAAASHPAWPAPITRTSCMPRALADVPRGTLLSKAEASKERVEHILDAGAAGQPVEGNAGDAKLLGHQHEVAGPRRAGER